MPRSRTRREPLQWRTSKATYAAVRAVLTDPRHGWVEERDFRLRPSLVSADDILVSPLMPDPDPDPVPGREPDIIEPYFGPEGGELRRTKGAAQRQALKEAGWTEHGDAPTGVCFRRPEQPDTVDAPIAADLASAPPGAPVRLMAIAAELGIGEGDLDEAVREAANGKAADAYNTGCPYPELDDHQAHDRADERASAINSGGIADQLAYLHQGCVSENALRALLTDLIR